MKPIIIERTEQGHMVLLRGVEVLRAYGVGVKQAGRYGDTVVIRDPSSGGLDLKSRKNAVPVAFFSEDDAMHLAHKIGRYKLGFGDLVFAYVDTAGFTPEGWDA